MAQSKKPTPDDIQRAKLRYGIVGNSPALVGAVSRALTVAPIDLSVLITGESGTGKEFFPKIIHGASPRKHARYIAVNCGAIPEGTIDSELFGHEKGAFTGAVATRKGYFEEADGGTVFLDEVAELPLTTQARLLRVLETGEFMKVGSSTVQRTDIRVVAATNVDMARAVAEGRFREDLYYRLSTVLIHLPPLRDRGKDIILLSRKFAADFAERYRTPEITFADGADEALMHYRWPGNVRQLKNVIDQIALFESGDTISAEMLDRYLPDFSRSYTPAIVGSASASPHSYEHERDLLFNMIFKMRGEIDRLRAEIEPAQRTRPAGEVIDVIETESEPVKTIPTSLMKYEGPLAEITHSPSASASTLSERDAIVEALNRCNGRRREAAAALGISERTLYRKLKEYNLD